MLEETFQPYSNRGCKCRRKRKETEVVGGSSAADEAEPSLEENTIPSSITNVPDEVLGGMSKSFYFSSSYRDLE